MTSWTVKAVAVAAALSMAALALPRTAEAGRRGDAAAAAIIGFGVGAIVGGAIASDRYYYGPPPPPRRYRRPPPAYYAAPPVVYAPAPVAYAPPPWTPDWYAYCHSKFPTFDAHSGTYLARDGRRYYCH